ncbi:MAG: dihydrolipoamide succinyltransferase [Sphingomonas bacterium]|uniref:dihydrolipoamide acetyltransferase family protein n=1 Tax=Sphingomonas bacterium TaxID=1895847 RepID=UPI00262E0DD7|nr:2-oxo acid dehydrogenase subunit E2 [Sphingomonas bacterium]MDB5710400.1 dihydrolipoamide succinyltransferase [Sphingomonas bacterium]
MIDILVPFEQEGTKAIVRSWLKKPGDRVALNDPLVELETDKVTQEVPSPGDGILDVILLDTDAEAVPGAILGRLRVAQAEVAESTAPAPAPVTEGAPPTSFGEARLSPAVRRAVRQHDIDVSAVSGTGRDGRITRADVDHYLSERDRAPAAPSPAPVASTTSPATGNVRSVPHDRMRLAIAQNMLNSVTVAPHVTGVFECDFSAIMAHRAKHKSAFQKAGANLTFTAYVIAASAEAMKVAPAINSRWYDDRLDIYEDINIGVGTALGEKGLVVPVVGQVQQLSLLGIAKRLTDLIARARDGKLTPPDMRGGTFTISNHGVSGSLFATPIIIAQPQSAILGVGKLEKRVVVREAGGIDTIQIRPLCYVSLTIDHRVVDGHQTNSWLSRFVELIEGWPLED